VQSPFGTVNEKIHSERRRETKHPCFKRLAVAIIRGQQILLPLGGTVIRGGDQLLIVTNEMTSAEDLEQLATSS
jgi:Trk K+ transport system NAD-binding subunit